VLRLKQQTNRTRLSQVNLAMKSSRQTARRHPVTRKGRTQKRKRGGTRTGIPRAVVIPSSRVVLLSYTAENREVVAGPSFVKQILSNSIANPFLVAPQPVIVGLTAVNTLYNYYRILMIRCKVFLTNNGANPVQVTLIKTVSNPGTNPVTYAKYARDGSGCVALLAPSGAAGSKSAITLRHQYRITKLVGTKQPLYADSYGGNLSGTPTPPVDNTYSCWGMESQGATLDVSWQLDCSFRVLIWDRIAQQTFLDVSPSPFVQARENLLHRTILDRQEKVVDQVAVQVGVHKALTIPISLTCTNDSF